MHPAHRGLFCVIEGIDGAGKSTLLTSLCNKLRVKFGREKVVLLQEPSLLPSGDKIRKLLASNKDLKAKKWLELFVEDRKNNLNVNVEPNIEAGNIVLQDRYYYSTAAYQGNTKSLIRSSSITKNEDNLSPQEIIDYHKKHKFYEADLLFYIFLDAKTAFERLKKSRSRYDSFEKIGTLERVLKNYSMILPQHTIWLDGRLNRETLDLKVLDYFN